MVRGGFRVSLAALALSCGVAAQAQPDVAASSFAAMKGLVGVWQVADKPASTLRIRFYLTAGGTVLVESWERAGQPYFLTLYHRDGAGLIATHYCPQGNQPRLALAPNGTPHDIRFAFRDATDLDAEHEAYLVSLALDLSNPAMLLRRESYREHGVDSPTELKLVRDQGR